MGYAYQSEENRRRVRRGHRAIALYPDGEYATSASFIVADVMHALNARDLDPLAIIEAAIRTYLGDFEDEDEDEPSFDNVEDVIEDARRVSGLCSGEDDCTCLAHTT